MEEETIVNDIVDLDELESLNPKPKGFRVKGKVLIQKELPVIEFFRIAKAFDAYQKENGKTDADVDKVYKDTLGLLVQMFKPFNSWIEPEFFSDQTQRKLTYLMKAAFDYQQAFALDESAEIPKEAPEDPLAGATSTPI